MDPDEALSQIRALVFALTQPRMDITVEQVCEEGEELAHLVDGLDKWLANGGFRPAAWQRREPETNYEATLRIHFGKLYDMGYHGHASGPKDVWVQQQIDKELAR